MNIVDEISRFFSNIFRQKVNTVRSQAQQKVRSAEVRARSKVAGGINNKINQSTKAAKDKATAKLQKNKEE